MKAVDGTHADHGAGFKCTPWAESHRPSLERPAAAPGAPSSGLVLPVGCAHGMPVCRGNAARLLPQGTALFTLAMHMVQLDDYHGLAELARRGSAQMLRAGSRCGFKVALSPEFSHLRGLPQILSVNQAGLLHYAVSIGSFRAAAALLVIFPELATSTCSVSLAESPANGTDTEQEWTPLQLVRLFCELYASDGSEPDVAKTLRQFTAASLVLEACAADCRLLPFLGLPTPQDRIAAAGSDAEAALAALIEAARSQGSCPGRADECLHTCPYA
jgi:hypothetical protein|eukprot:Tamp_21929.p1 GENE.Tamp_21929~~Tamp_21929.p1  ORF type:complete len:273 (+),score=40.53 Tamp_21929:83-901(+)